MHPTITGIKSNQIKSNQIKSNQIKPVKERTDTHAEAGRQAGRIIMCQSFIQLTPHRRRYRYRYHPFVLILLIIRL